MPDVSSLSMRIVMSTLIALLPSLDLPHVNLTLEGARQMVDWMDPASWMEYRNLACPEGYFNNLVISTIIESHGENKPIGVPGCFDQEVNWMSQSIYVPAAEIVSVALATQVEARTSTGQRLGVLVKLPSVGSEYWIKHNHQPFKRYPTNSAGIILENGKDGNKKYDSQAFNKKAPPVDYSQDWNLNNAMQRALEAMDSNHHNVTRFPAGFVREAGSLQSRGHPLSMVGIAQDMDTILGADSNARVVYNGAFQVYNASSHDIRPTLEISNINKPYMTVAAGILSLPTQSKVMRQKLQDLVNLLQSALPIHRYHAAIKQAAAKDNRDIRIEAIKTFRIQMIPEKFQNWE
jgi:hypothetical protein